jgi:hypothetical protein
MISREVVARLAATVGPDALLAAALPGVRGDGCRWCWARATSRVEGRTEPHRWTHHRDAETVGLMVKLLGVPCSTCARDIRGWSA